MLLFRSSRNAFSQLLLMEESGMVKDTLKIQPMCYAAPWYRDRLSTNIIPSFMLLLRCFDSISPYRIRTKNMSSLGFRDISVDHSSKQDTSRCATPCWDAWMDRAQATRGKRVVPARSAYMSALVTHANQVSLHVIYLIMHLEKAVSVNWPVNMGVTCAKKTRNIVVYT